MTLNKSHDLKLAVFMKKGRKPSKLPLTFLFICDIQWYSAFISKKKKKKKPKTLLLTIG